MESTRAENSALESAQEVGGAVFDGEVRAYFPEPTADDRTWARVDEEPGDWLARSTLPRAKAIRASLNLNLSRFDPKHARSVAKRLRTDWRSHYFELVVGRYLQEAGALIEYEPRGSNGTHVDYRATFADGVSSIECVAKVYNKAALDEQKRTARLLSRLEMVCPRGWALLVHEVPLVSLGEFSQYLEPAAAWLARLPDPTDEADQREFGVGTGQHRLAFTVLPRPDAEAPIWAFPAVGYVDNSIQRVQQTLSDRRKRRQAVGATPPVLLAIDAPFAGPDVESLDQALIGQTMEHLGFNLETLGYSFKPNGALVADPACPFAGVLAFGDCGVFSAKEPVLYLNPHQPWGLPAALAGLETRSFATDGVVIRPASRSGAMGAVSFAQRE
jgi:hypothetical protein